MWMKAARRRRGGRGGYCDCGFGFGRSAAAG